jgi:hypothetical protein
MATGKSNREVLWQGKGKWIGWRVDSWKTKRGYLIVNLTRPKASPIYSVMTSPNVLRLAFRKG